MTLLNEKLDWEKELFTRFCVYSDYQNKKNKRWVWKSKGSPKDVRRWFRAVLHNVLQEKLGGEV